MVDDLEHAVMDLLSFRLLNVLQEILDKLLDIELVVNFKCAEDYLLEHHGDNVFSHSHQSDRFSGSGCRSLNVDSPRTQTKYSFCNGKAHIHHKQVFLNSHISLPLMQKILTFLCQRLAV